MEIQVKQAPGRPAAAAIGRARLWSAFEFVTRPGLYFEKRAKSPGGGVPILAVCLGGAILGFLMIPYVQRATELQVLRMLGRAGLDRLGRSHGIYLWSAALSPVGTVASCMIQAVALMLAAKGVAGRGSFRQAFSLISHASLFSLAAAATVYVVLCMRGLDAIRSPEDVKVAMGLNFFWQNTHPAIDALLSDLSPYRISYFALLAIGLRRMCGCTGRQALVTILLYFVLQAGWVMSTAVLANGMAHAPYSAAKLEP